MKQQIQEMMGQPSGGPPMQQKMPMGQPPAQPMASQGARGAVDQANRKQERGNTPGATPKELNALMAQAVNTTSKALYDSPKIQKSVLGMINKQEKVGSTAKAAVQFLSQMAEKAQIPPRIMPGLATMTMDEIMQLAEAKGVARYDEQEAMQVIGTGVEMILKVYGVSPEKAAEMGARMSKQDLQKGEQSYKAMLGEDPGQQGAPQAPPQAPPQQGAM